MNKDIYTVEYFYNNAMFEKEFDRLSLAEEFIENLPAKKRLAEGYYSFSRARILKNSTYISLSEDKTF